MTTKDIFELIEAISNLNFKDHIFLRPIGETVLEGRVSLKIGQFDKQSQYPVSMSRKFYFIKNKSDEVVAAVEDRGDKAEPVRIEGYLVPLPMKYFALNSGKKLKAYIEELLIK